MSPEQRQFILSLDRDGYISPDDVLEAAKPEKSPIHDMFTWDDSVAGHRFRIEEARAVIRRIQVNYIPSEPKVRDIRVSEYVRDPDLPNGENGYVRTGILRTRRDSAVAALENELARIDGLVARARMVAAKLELDAECEAGLRAIIAKKWRKAG